MIIRNFLDAPGVVQSVHGGAGLAKNARVFDACDFDTPLRFISYLELEPGASIGVHRHGDNEEVYVVLAGSGVLITNGERRPVKTGDISVNKPGWEHGLENTSGATLRLFVFEVNQARQA